MISAGEIVALQDRLTRLGRETASGRESRPGQFGRRVARQHNSNFDLWHFEDEARAPRMSGAKLAAL